MKLIDKDVLVAEIEKQRQLIFPQNTGEMKVADVPKPLEQGWLNAISWMKKTIDSLEVKEVGVWKTVDNINPPQADRNKIYCVFTKDRHILATVINHPKDEELLQWKCTEFPNHRYDMCEGDEYMQIV